MKKGLRRVGFLGGSFDPIHWGHIQLARGALEAASLDLVLLMAAKDPPHKRLQASAAHRLQMARLAVQEEPGLYASGLELSLPGRGYTVHTVRALKERLPEAELFFITGSDVLASLPDWYGARELLASVRLLCAPRPGPASPAPEALRALGQRRHVAAELLDLSLPDISSSQVRALLQEGQPVSRYLPPPVEAYIRARSLYR